MDSTSVTANTAQTLRIHNANINTFLGIRDLGRHGLISVDLHGNQLWSFEHFGTHNDLRELNVSHNSITTFMGMTKQRNLQSLQLEGCPVALHPHYRIMALLTIGFSLRTIDGVRVEPNEREAARRLGPNAALAVSCGWLLDMTPRFADDYDRIVDEMSRKRKEIIRNRSKDSEKTVLAALDEISRRTASASPDRGGEEGGSPFSRKREHTIYSEHRERAADTRQADAVEPLREKTLAFLSKRVLELEQQLSDSKRQLANARVMEAAGVHDHQHRRHGSPTTTIVDQASDSLVARGSTAKQQQQQQQQKGVHVLGLTPAEMATCDTVSFTEHLTVSSNVASSSSASASASSSQTQNQTQQPQRATLSVSKDAISIHSFFSRSVLAQRQIKELAEMFVDVVANNNQQPPTQSESANSGNNSNNHRLQLSFNDGAQFLISTLDERMLSCIHKLLHFRCGLVPQPLCLSPQLAPSDTVVVAQEYDVPPPKTAQKDEERKKNETTTEKLPPAPKRAANPKLASSAKSTPKERTSAPSTPVKEQRQTSSSASAFKPESEKAEKVNEPSAASPVSNRKKENPPSATAQAQPTNPDDNDASATSSSAPSPPPTIQNAAKDKQPDKTPADKDPQSPVRPVAANNKAPATPIRTQSTTATAAPVASSEKNPNTKDDDASTATTSSASPPRRRIVAPRRSSSDSEDEEDATATATTSESTTAATKRQQQQEAEAQQQQQDSPKGPLSSSSSFSGGQRQRVKAVVKKPTATETTSASAVPAPAAKTSAPTSATANKREPSPDATTEDTSTSSSIKVPPKRKVLGRQAMLAQLALDSSEDSEDG